MADIQIGITLSAKDRITRSLRPVRKAFGSTFDRVARGARRVTGSLAKLTRKGIDGFKRMTATLGGVKTALLGVAAGLLGGVGLGVAFRKVTDLAGVQEQAVTRLGFALAAAGVQGAQAASRDFQAFAAELQNVSRFGDEAIISAAAMGARLGLTGDELKRNTTLAADLSAATGKDLTASMTLLARVAKGDVTVLKRMGIEVDTSGTKAEQAADAFDKLTAAFGGAALADIQTFGGRVQQASNAFGDLLEQIGMIFTKSSLLNALVVEATRLWGDLGSQVQENRQGFTELAERAILKVSDAFLAVVRVVGRVQQAFNLLKATGALVLEGILRLTRAQLQVWAKLVSSMITGINAVRAAFGKEPVGQELSAGLDEAIGKVDGMIAAAQEMRGEFVANISAIEERTKATTNRFTEFRNNVLETAKTIETVAPPVADAMGMVEESVGKVDEKLKKTKSTAEVVAGKIGDAFSTVFERIVLDQENAREVILSTFQQMSKDLVKEFLDKAIKALTQKALQAIGVSAAEGAAGAAKGAATGLPFPANIIVPPVVAAGMFATISAFKNKFQSGGLIPSGPQIPGGTADSVPFLGVPGEAVVDKETTNRLRRLLKVGPAPTPSLSAPARPLGFQAGGMVPAMAGGMGGRGPMTIIVKQETAGLPDRATSRRWIRDVIDPELQTLRRRGTR